MTKNETVVHALKIANAHESIRHIFIRDLRLAALIGVYNHEKENLQPIRINLDLGIKESPLPNQDRLQNVVSYEDIARGTRRIVADGHVNLAETLAEKIADMCFEYDRVQMVRVRIEKLAVFEDAASAGVEIERRRSEQN